MTLRGLLIMAIQNSWSHVCGTLLHPFASLNHQLILQSTPSSRVVVRFFYLALLDWSKQQNVPFSIKEMGLRNLRGSIISKTEDFFKTRNSHFNHIHYQTQGHPGKDMFSKGFWKKIHPRGHRGQAGVISPGATLGNAFVVIDVS